jgi:hypothetical protein
MGKRSVNVRGAAGNIKLNGKKTAMFSCGCCDAFNFKDLVTERRADKEILDFLKEQDTNKKEEKNEN